MDVQHIPEETPPPICTYCGVEVEMDGDTPQDEDAVIGEEVVCGDCRREDLPDMGVDEDDRPMYGGVFG